ncbi:SAM-dependent methyltransferase [Symbiobacterium terraclitae]|jgi:SAM-dependent methyltransferase|uniref:SAM-dependent methyltransferase n=1 Tax=Symbiobacterium terraclitae TaxID=557451 RepID=A0ABS4JT35_9FIRM|nr:class I SAM-dependent methyltransferase [Symbiobacterium terraclitae]MBP2017629.1 SAM-dependent methyltransferase [Symbiobacterium terraclitae]
MTNSQDLGTKAEVRRQFGTSAEQYLTSTIHAKGEDLALLPDIAGLTGTEEILDVATGTGHTVLALAPHARRVVGVDLTPEMVSIAREQAERRGFGNVSFAVADAETLPFPDGSFDVVTCRIAAHHFPAVERFCREAARVLRPGGRLVVVDNVAPEEPELDRFINEVEKLRDPSHHKAYRLSEWQAFVEGAGLRFTVAHRFTTRVDRENWLGRAATPPAAADQVRALLAGAPAAARDRFAITDDGFVLHKAILIGRKV